MDFLSDQLARFFAFIHGGISGTIVDPNLSFGITIIVFTIIIRIIILPLNIKQIRSTVKMSEIQPEVKRLQDKYKNDPQKAQQEMMKLYKERGVNPLGGCLPLLIQMPILFALFAMFRSLSFTAPGMAEPAGFLWLTSLVDPDPLYILPVLSTITTFISSKLMQPAGDSAQAKQTSTMNTAMAVFFGFMSIKFQAALVLYWVVNNTIQIIQTLVMKNTDKSKKALGNA